MPESARQRDAFDRYWRMPNRSLERLHEEWAAAGDDAPALRTLYEWSRRYHWQRRLGDLEAQALQAEDEARIAALREMRERQAKEALLLQRRGAEWLQDLDPEAVGPEHAIRALIEGSKLERIVRGDVSDRTEVRHESDPRLERFTDDELAELIELAERAVDRDAPPQSG